MFSSEYSEIFTNSSFDRTQFDEVTIMGICRVLFIINNKMWDGYYYKGLKIFSEYVIYILLVEAIPTRF